jgi:hypothetical protein
MYVQISICMHALKRTQDVMSSVLISNDVYACIKKNRGCNELITLRNSITVASM